MKIKRIVSVVCLLLILSLTLTLSAQLLKRKYSCNQYRIFYEKSTEFDVLFFGASVVHYAVYPMQLWNDYGITSYNMANDSERLAMTYYDIVNALDYANPKMIVLDLSATGWAGAKRDGTLKDHFFLDSVPMSVNKLREINDIFEGKERFEYLFPFSLYHSRWSELEMEDFFLDTRDIKYGADPHSGVMKTPKPSPANYEESRETDVTLEYDNIRKIADLCKERGITLIFTNYPSGHRGGDQKNHEALAKMMEEYENDYYDFLFLDFIDWDRDFVEGAHLNYYGGVKLTDYIGKLLTDKYGMPDRRTDSNISSSWNEDYEQYKAEMDLFVENTIEEYEAAGKN